MSEITTNTKDFAKIHVVFLHSMLRKRPEDRYLVDIAMAMKEAGHKVSIYTSEFEKQNCFQEVDSVTGSLNVYYSGWWLPRKFKFLRSILMAVRMIFFPPKPKPAVVVLNINTVALYLIGLLSSYKTIYLPHFNGLHQVEHYTKFMKISPSMMITRALKYADDIVVQSEGLADIFKRSFPNVRKEIKILHPCVDAGLPCEEDADIKRIVPDIPEPNFLFVCFGCYKKRSNFELVLNAFDDLLLIIAANIRNNLHLVIAGHCGDRSLQEKIYYEELLRSTKDKCCRTQVTFLKEVAVGHRKILIEEAIGVIFPCKHDVFPDIILPVLSVGRPIIATKSGFAKVALRHRLTGILVEPSPEMFAAAMFKVLTNPAIQCFLSDMVQDVYCRKYSNNVFRRKVNGIVLQYAKEQPM